MAAESANVYCRKRMKEPMPAMPWVFGLVARVEISIIAVVVERVVVATRTEVSAQHQ